ncbi:putative short-chain dehydrogenase [Phaeomoniella chlamydospora]|uniref:Putative short-chain dehydrogenase n=1 Tax=Phaeomoniella chlamydospora TaxID=158046 RepID=A0A0G2GWH9_PHACM|nr:putative short-chain dehydrogenase [Phaeomoniella chlamydospora]
MASHPQFKDSTEAAEVAGTFASSVKDKIVLITGVSPNSIGEGTAKALASHSPTRLILASRSVSKIEAVISSLKSTFPSSSTVYQILEMDLSDLDSVRAAASSILHDQEIPHINLLINNAGIMLIPARTLSPCGQEIHLTTNHISHFLLTNLLLPKLLAAGPDTRILNLTSSGHNFSPFRFTDPTFLHPLSSLPPSEVPDLNLVRSIFGPEQTDMLLHSTNPSSYHPALAYAQSKTANILFSLQLNLLPRLQKSGIRSYAVHPGSVETNLGRHVPAEEMQKARDRAKASDSMFITLRKNPDQGASTTLVAALDPGLPCVEIEEVDVDVEAAKTDPQTISAEKKKKQIAKNIYFADCQIADTLCKTYARDVDAAEKLWEWTEGVVGEKFSWE